MASDCYRRRSTWHGARTRWREAGVDAPHTLFASGDVMPGTTPSNELTPERLAAVIVGDQGLAINVLVRDPELEHRAEAGRGSFVKQG